MRESEGSAVMSGDVWDLGLANVLLDDSAKLETSLFGIDFVWVESSLSVEEDSEELIRFFNSNNVHLTERESVISSDLTVDLDETLLLPANLHSFLASQGVAQSLLKKDVHWDALSQLVWTWRWSGSIHSLKFAEVPVLWCRNSFHAFSLTFIALNNRETTQIRICWPLS